jgi:hypothetical protein
MSQYIQMELAVAGPEAPDASESGEGDDLPADGDERTTS